MTPETSSNYILRQLEEVCFRCPELRFGQLLATIGMLAEDATGFSLWDVEDADFAAALNRFAADMAHRELGNAGPGRSAVASTPTSTPPLPPRPVS